jgi:hypothetical protein
MIINKQKICIFILIVLVVSFKIYYDGIILIFLKRQVVVFYNLINIYYIIQNSRYPEIPRSRFPHKRSSDQFNGVPGGYCYFSFITFF